MIAVGAALLVVLAGVLCRTDVYGAFLRGAQQGMETAKSILPALCAALWMTACLRGSGALEELARAAGPLLSALGIPAELLPFLAVRPVSGAAALAELSQLMARIGADSRASRMAAAMMSSSETVLYVLALYLGAAKRRAPRWLLPCALVSMAVGMIVSALCIR